MRRRNKNNNNDNDDDTDNNPPLLTAPSLTATTKTAHRKLFTFFYAYFSVCAVCSSLCWLVAEGRGGGSIVHCTYFYGFLKKTFLWAAPIPSQGKLAAVKSS